MATQASITAVPTEMLTPWLDKGTNYYLSIGVPPNVAGEIVPRRSAFAITYANGPSSGPWALSLSPSWNPNLSVQLETGWGGGGTLTTNSPYLPVQGGNRFLNYFRNPDGTPSTCTLTITWTDPVTGGVASTASTTIGG